MRYLYWFTIQDPTKNPLKTPFPSPLILDGLELPSRTNRSGERWYPYHKPPELPKKPIAILFFMIGKKNYIQITARCKKVLAIRKYKNEKKQKEKRKKKNINYREEELRKKGIELLEVSPQALAQSKREPAKRASSWSSDLSRSSNVRRLRSFQMHHIKHSGTRFQMLE